MGRHSPASPLLEEFGGWGIGVAGRSRLRVWGLWGRVLGVGFGDCGSGFWGYWAKFGDDGSCFWGCGVGVGGSGLRVDG